MYESREDLKREISEEDSDREFKVFKADENSQEEEDFSDSDSEAEYEDQEEIQEKERTEPLSPLVVYLLEHMNELTSELKTAVQEDCRHHGFWDFLQKYSVVPFKVLLEIFDAPIAETEDLPDDELLPLLHKAIHRKIAKRQKRQDINTIEQTIELINSCKNIVVLTGAGVSVSCGIPDFRSKNGIYSRLSEFQLDDPQQMFDLEYFKINPKTFYSFAHEIYPSNFTPSPSHMFIKLLQDKGKLLRNYTQNIDTIETLAGITRLVQCHGSFASARCIKCKVEAEIKDIEKEIFAKTVPMCPHCPEEDEGIIKPDITFFGEKLPDKFDNCFAEDKEKIDLLIVMGSSLKVSPVADFKDKIPHDTPQILINMESLPHMSGFDVQLLGKCDIIVQELCKRLGWELKSGKSAVKKIEEKHLFEENTSPWEFIQPNVYLFEGASAARESSSESEHSELSPDSNTDNEGLGLATLYELE